MGINEKESIRVQEARGTTWRLFDRAEWNLRKWFFIAVDDLRGLDPKGDRQRAESASSTKAEALVFYQAKLNQVCARRKTTTKALPWTAFYKLIQAEHAQKDAAAADDFGLSA